MNLAQLQKIMQTALVHHQAGRLGEAEKLYRQARLAAPGQFDPFHLSGTLAYQQSRFQDAVELLTRAYRMNPKMAVCEMRLGLALAAVGRHVEAEKRLRGAVEKDPKSAEAWNNLAFTLRVIGRVAEAKDAYGKAIEAKPDFYEAIDRLGALVADTQGLPAGIPYFRRAIEVKPSYAPAWANLGLALNADRKLTEAIAAFDRALKLDPKLVQARVGRALAYQQSYRIEEAAKEFGAAAAQDPLNHEARTGRLLTLNYLNTLSRAELFAEHLAYDRGLDQGGFKIDPATVKFGNSLEPDRRLRVAFLSPDLRTHSVAFFIEPILRYLDRSLFQVYLYHDHFLVDELSKKLGGMAEVWRNFVGQMHDVVEKTIRADAPDILVDLAGHTGLSRLPVFARRVAPVQISYLGYPNTTGLRTMDYRFVDAITDPPGEDDAFHTEKLVRFSRCNWTFQPPVDAPLPSRVTGDANATEAPPIVFGSFNNFAKVSDETLRLWAQVLAAVPGSQLLLKGHGLPDAGTTERVQQRLALLNVEPSRIRLLGRTPGIADHLTLYSEIDIALDTFPYHGTTTTCEALWMGVPVVTLQGNRHASRVSASILTAVGHPEWIAHQSEQYVAIARELANDPSQRARLRHALRDDLWKSPLLDHAGQSARFGEALRACWREKTALLAGSPASATLATARL